VIEDIIARARAEGRSALDERSGKTLLSSLGIRIPKSALVTDATAAHAALLGELTPPFAVKVVSREILHKSDVGGVALNVMDADGVARAIAAMAKKEGIIGKPVEGWLVEEMVPPGREMVVGGLADPQFGPMLMVGLGGIFVEVLKDVSFRICPISEADANEMVSDLKGAALLDGARGETRVDKSSLIDVMLRIGGTNGLLIQAAGDIAEIDLNPVIVTRNSAVAADARFVL
jgi:succinyl-CoA synthetase beta subunit